jgi:hypothetical protein
MKNNFLAFFFIALISELATSWLQKFQGARDMGDGLFYPDVGTMMMSRLIIWLVLFLLLSVLWLLLSRGFKKT